MNKYKKNKEIIDDSYVYVFLLTTLNLLIFSLGSYTFQIENISLSYSLFFLPINYFILNYIIKKFGYKKSIVAIIISSSIIIFYNVVMNFTLSRKLFIYDILGYFIAYVVSNFVNLFVYYILDRDTRVPFSLLFFNYTFTIIIFYLVYTLININKLVLDGYMLSYFSSILINIIIGFVLSFVHKIILKDVNE